MKRRLNILCVIVFLVLGLSLYSTGYQFGMGMKLGMNIAEKQMEKVKKSTPPTFLLGDFKTLEIVPAAALWESDSLLNAKTGKYMPAVYSKVLVKVNDEVNISSMVASLVCSLLNLLATATAIFFFIQLIYNINRSRIFEWRNVTSLRWLGALLIFSFVCTLWPRIVCNWGISEQVELSKYVIAPISLQLTDIFLGLGCLIVAEIFSIGLKMKEEQDLTI